MIEKIENKSDMRTMEWKRVVNEATKAEREKKVLYHGRRRFSQMTQVIWQCYLLSCGESGNTRKSWAWRLKRMMPKRSEHILWMTGKKWHIKVNHNWWGSKTWTTKHSGPEQPKIRTQVLGHTFIHLLALLPHSLAPHCVFHTAHFAHTLRCTHSFAHLLTNSQACREVND